MEAWPRMVRMSQVRVKMSFQKLCSWKRGMSELRSSLRILDVNADNHSLVIASGHALSMVGGSTLRCWRVGQSKGACGVIGTSEWWQEQRWGQTSPLLGKAGHEERACQIDCVVDCDRVDRTGKFSHFPC